MAAGSCRSQAELSAPLDVTWGPADRSLAENWDELVRLAETGIGWSRQDTWASGPDELAGSGGTLARILVRVPTGRLVVLGERGAGKTILMVRLVLDLLTVRANEIVRANDPVPVLISLASWNPHEAGLFDWLGTRLTIDYPALAQRVREGGLSRAEALLRSHRILPILDGLDEIPDQIRGTAIAAINEALQLGISIVLTSRTESYSDTVHARFGSAAILQAAAIQLHPLTPETVAGYLLAGADDRDSRERWSPVIDVLGTQAPVGQALTTPLMVGLARNIYNSSEAASTPPNPAELLDARLANRESVEGHLLDAYLRAAYRPAHGTIPRWAAPDAERYLSFVASHLRSDVSDIAWWNLAGAAPKYLAGLAVGLLTAVASGVAYPFIGWGLGILTGLVTGLLLRMRVHAREEDLTRGFLGGLLGGVTAALLILVLLGPGVHGYRESGLLAAGLTVGVAVASLRDFTVSLVAGFFGSGVAGLYEHAPAFSTAREAVGPWLHLINAFGFGLAALLYVELAGREKPARRLRLSPVWLALGISCGIVLGIGVWLQTNFLQGVVTGLIAAIAGALVGALGETVETDVTIPADPMRVLRHDRNAFLSGWLIVGLTFGFGGGFALAVSPNIHGQPNGILTGMSVGLANVIVIGLTFGFVQAMWGSYTLAKFWFAISRRLPWMYMAFLSYSHSRGILGQAGTFYQFRHMELQERLLKSDRKPGHG